MVWQPGKSGNPNGRPRGHRDKLTNLFLMNVASLWEEKGSKALEDALRTDPVQFCKMVASLMPKEVVVEKRPEADLTDEELIAALDYWRAIAVAKSNSQAPGSGINAASGSQQAGEIPAVH
jgi:hypothetical protein